jgi:hypothetical protein
MEETKDYPKATHDTNVDPGEDIAQALAGADRTIAIEELVDAATLGITVFRSGYNNPGSCDAKGGYDQESVESNVSAVESWLLLNVCPEC